MKTIKLIKKFIKHSDGNSQDIKDFKERFKNMDWRQKTVELKKMVELMGGINE